MGLIKAGLGAIGGTLADQWKEFFYCESMSADVLVKKGEKRTSKRSSNKKGNDNIISNGSTIAINDGQCMIITEQGKIVEFCAEPGEFTYDTSTEPSIFTGKLKDSIKETFKLIGKRFTYGGDTAKDQRIYYFNTKEIVGNKYGTQNPIPFRVVDNKIGLDVDISVRCNGEYSYKIVDPLLFYTNVCGNVENEYLRENIDSMLRTELLTALGPAFAKISEMGIRYSAIPGHTQELSDTLNEILSNKWHEQRGLEIVSFGVNSITTSKENEDMIKELQKSAVMRDPLSAGANLVSAQADAMRNASNNPAGVMNGFVGLNMANNAGGFNPNMFFSSANANSNTNVNKDTWTCSCGAVNSGKFCSECGNKRPPTDNLPQNTWTCSCGTVNSGKFCSECGKPFQNN